ncbi:MAG: hypothetical protein AAFR77_19755 [Cyanobacteria bacterium J06631_2]
MTDSKDNSPPQSTKDNAAERETEKPQKPAKEKERLKFKDEDTIGIKFDF